MPFSKSLIYLYSDISLQGKVTESRATWRSHPHGVVLLVHSLQVLLELLQLAESVLRQLPVLLQLAVHLLKLQGRIIIRDQGQERGDVSGRLAGAPQCHKLRAPYLPLVDGDGPTNTAGFSTNLIAFTVHL